MEVRVFEQKDENALYKIYKEQFDGLKKKSSYNLFNKENIKEKPFGLQIGQGISLLRDASILTINNQAAIILASEHAPVIAEALVILSNTSIEMTSEIYFALYRAGKDGVKIASNVKSLYDAGIFYFERSSVFALPKINPFLLHFLLSLSIIEFLKSTDSMLKRLNGDSRDYYIDAFQSFNEHQIPLKKNVLQFFLQYSWSVKFLIELGKMDMLKDNVMKVVLHYTSNDDEKNKKIIQAFNQFKMAGIEPTDKICQALLYLGHQPHYAAELLCFLKKNEILLDDGVIDAVTKLDPERVFKYDAIVMLETLKNIGIAIEKNIIKLIVNTDSTIFPNHILLNILRDLHKNKINLSAQMVKTFMSLPSEHTFNPPHYELQQFAEAMINLNNAKIPLTDEVINGLGITIHRGESILFYISNLVNLKNENAPLETVKAAAMVTSKKSGNVVVAVDSLFQAGILTPRILNQVFVENRHKNIQECVDMFIAQAMRKTALIIFLMTQGNAFKFYLVTPLMDIVFSYFPLVQSYLRPASEILYSERLLDEGAIDGLCEQRDKLFADHYVHSVIKNTEKKEDETVKAIKRIVKDPKIQLEFPPNVITVIASFFQRPPKTKATVEEPKETPDFLKQRRLNS